MIRDLLLCERRLALDIHGDPEMRDQASPFVSMLWRDGLLHEQQVLSQLPGPVIDLRVLKRHLREAGTIKAIDDGAPTILGAVIHHDDAVGMPDLLIWSWSGHIAADVKSGAAVEGERANYKKEYLVQVAHYAWILENTGLGRGDEAAIIDRTGATTTYDLSVPIGREKLTGKDLHGRLLADARLIAATPRWNPRRLFGTARHVRLANVLPRGARGPP